MFRIKNISVVAYCIGMAATNGKDFDADSQKFKDRSIAIGKISSSIIENSATDQSILGEGESANLENPCCTEGCLDEKKGKFDKCNTDCYLQDPEMKFQCGFDGPDWDDGYCQALSAAYCYGAGDLVTVLPFGFGAGSAGGKYVLGPYLYDWYEAQHYCKYRHGTELASIHSEYDYWYTIFLCDFAWRYYETQGIDAPIQIFDGCWIGLYQFGQAGASISGGGAGDLEGPSEPNTPSAPGAYRGWYNVDGSKIDGPLEEDKGTKLGTLLLPIANDYTESQNCMAIQAFPDGPGWYYEWNDFSCTAGETIFPSRGSGWRPQYALCNGPKYYKKPPKPSKDLAAARAAVESNDIYKKSGFIGSMSMNDGLKSNEPQTVTYRIELSQSMFIMLLSIIIIGAAICTYYNFRGGEKLKTITNEMV